MKKLNTKGFAPLHIVLVLVVIGLIAGVGYYVYNSQKKTNTALDNAANSQPEPQKTEKKEESTQQPQANTATVKYLEIKELGVKIVLTSGIEDSYYKIENGTPYLSVHALDKYPGCSQIAAVSVAKVGDDRFGSPWTKEDLEKISSLKILDEYFWIEPSNGGSCSDPTGNNPAQAETNARKELTQAKLEKL